MSPAIEVAGRDFCVHNHPSRGFVSMFAECNTDRTVFVICSIFSCMYTEAFKTVLTSSSLTTQNTEFKICIFNYDCISTERNTFNMSN